MQIIAAILATWRLTDIATVDRISLKVRQRWPLYIWTCPRCVSVWTGLIALGLYLYLPYANWPLALSEIFILKNWVLATVRPQALPQPQAETSRRVVIEVDPSGNQNVKSDFDTASTKALIGRIAEAFR